MEEGKEGEKREERGGKGVICSQGIKGGKERSSSTGVLVDWCKRKRDDSLVDREGGY